LSHTRETNTHTFVVYVHYLATRGHTQCPIHHCCTQGVDHGGSKEGQGGEGIVLRFATNAYEASAAVESFLPAFAVVDLETTAARENGLLESLCRDPRLPGLKTVVAVRQGRSKRRGGLNGSPFVAGRLEKPFDLGEIQAVIDSFPVECI
jgi:hypothetical protein